MPPPARRRLICCVMIILLIPIVLTFCKQGSREILPILPSSEYNFEETDTGSADMSNDITDSRSLSEGDDSKLRSRISPFMPVEIVEEMETELSVLIGDQTPEDNQLVLIEVKPSGQIEYNPPVLQFTFAAPKDSIKPEDISVYFDGKDISSIINYNVFYSRGRNANFYVGYLRPSRYIKPTVNHSISVTFNSANLNSESRNVNFSVPNPDDFKISYAGFPKAEGSDLFKLNELLVQIDKPNYIDVDRELINPANWEIRLDDPGNLPTIREVRKLSPHVYLIRFETSFETKKQFRIKYSGSNGISTNELELASPFEKFSRGGSVSRQAMEWQECLSCQIDQWGYNYAFEDWVVQEVDSCKDNHYWLIDTYCPPDIPCYPGIEELVKITDYTFEDRYEEDWEEEGTAHEHPEIGGGVAGDCPLSGGIERNPDFRLDVDSKYTMLAWQSDPPGYCKVDELDLEKVWSDTTIPDFADIHFELDTNCTDSPNCPGKDCNAATCTDCEKWIEYRMVIEAYDDRCLLEETNFRFLIKYTNVDDLYAVAFPSASFHFGCDKYIHKEYYVDPNFFACADYLKVIVEDKKGNWKARRVKRLPDRSTVYIPTYLPYPDRFEVSLDERLPSGPFNQYVNLSSEFEEEMDQEVCEYRLKQDPQQDLDANHGPYIYVRVDTIPSLSGIEVTINYSDPVNVYPDKSPTNTRAGTPGPDHCIVFNPGSENIFNESANGDLEQDEYHKLWSQHQPYGGDSRLLGDNWNYYIEESSQIDGRVPICDPIRTNDSKNPCFYNLFVPPILQCTKCRCIKGSLPKYTNYNGKYAVYFNAKSHGGDNFQFYAKAHNPYIDGISDCMFAPNGTVVTLWRKIYVNYAFMEDRGGLYPDPLCQGFSQDKEYQFVNAFSDLVFNELKGVYDDCFIEILDKYQYSDTHYELHIDNWSPTMAEYGDDQTDFRPNPPKDTLVLIGVDHCVTDCAQLGSSWGLSVDHWSWYTHICCDDAFYDFVEVGGIYDWLSIYGAPQFNDKEVTNDSNLITAMNASHEFGHTLLNQGDDPAHSKAYGIMCTWVDSYKNRRYLHLDHIMELRDQLKKFDSVDY